MKTLNKILQRQITKHFGSLENTPHELLPFLKVISETYYHDEKDRKMLERSIELSSREMKELNSHLAEEVLETKKAKEKLINANRLYAFISQINQTIVHVTDEQTLFNETCRIAVAFGEFEMALIGIVDEPNRKLNLMAHYNATPDDLQLFNNMAFVENGPIANVILQGTFYAINDYARESDNSFWRQYAFAKEFHSSITLPIKKSGSVAYILVLFSKKANIFTEREISSLEESADDISFALDVFENERKRKHFENKIKHNELRLQQAQEIAHVGSWELDFASGVATWSDEALRIYGIPLVDNQQTYESWLSFVHPEDLEYVLQITKESQTTLTNTSFYHRIIRKDGTAKHIHSQTRFVFNSQEKPIGLYGVAHDVTDGKLAEELLQQSKANLRLIVDLIPQAVFAMNDGGKFVFVNNSFAKLYGSTPKQLVSKTIYEILPDKNAADYFVEQAREVIQTGNTKIIPEMKFTDYTGAVKIFYSTKVPFELVGKHEKAMLGISLDITEQRNAEIEREKMIADIVQRNKDLEQFSYIVSHNLRAPVANIIGLADLFKIIPINVNEHEGKIMMCELSASVEKLDNVIKDLNYVLQIKHQVNEKKESIRFSELCEDVRLSLSHLLKSQNVQFNCDFSAVDEMFTLKSYLYSVFFNLISNSIKYRRPDIPLVIGITSRKYDNKIELIFRDNGLGINLKQNENQVFGLYKRFHSHIEGKGMGLFMVKTQVESLGGKIALESEVNKGTIFKISFEGT